MPLHGLLDYTFLSTDTKLSVLFVIIKTEPAEARGFPPKAK